MRQFLRDLWYGEPVVVLGLISTGLLAYVGFGSPPQWAVVTALIVQALAGFYGRQLSQPFRVDKLSDPRLTVPEAVITEQIPVNLDVIEQGDPPAEGGAVSVLEALVIALLLLLIWLLIQGA